MILIADLQPSPVRLMTAGVPHNEPTLDDWRQLYRNNARPLYRYLLRLTFGNREEAEDHLQETFLRAWRWVRQNPADLTTIRPWLFTVARHIVIDAARAEPHPAMPGEGVPPCREKEAGRDASRCCSVRACSHAPASSSMTRNRT
jgi:DNA-directed RNA polymerase specialized sigma24 family protein